VGEIESGGTIRKQGSIWGSATNCAGFDGKRTAAAVLVFFSTDF
jgi:hypothetical protein